jgi:hypothetical protein
MRLAMGIFVTLKLLQQILSLHFHGTNALALCLKSPEVQRSEFHCIASNLPFNPCLFFPFMASLFLSFYISLISLNFSPSQEYTIE